MHDRALAALCRVTSELASDARLAARVQAATDLAVGALGADHGSVRVCGHDASLTPIARSGVGVDTPPTPLRSGQGLLGWAVETRQAVRVADAQTDARFESPGASGFAVRSLISIPLMACDRALGVFSVSKAEPGAFDVSHELAATAMGHCIGQALQIAELQRQATTDSMTGALNRAGLLPTLDAQMNRARRDGTPLSVLLMDLDHFKTVNDRFGHAVGDAMLAAFAQTVRDTVRDFDILIRRGGEEFELVMPTTEPAGGLEVAERVRDRLAHAPLRFGATIQLQQTVSIGVATWDGTEDARSLDHRADLAMYAAKTAGRNRVCVAPRATPTPALPKLVHAG